MLTPTVSGMACTDEFGRLFFTTNDKNILIARHPNVPKWVSPMDFSVLKRFLDLHWKNGTLVVIGSNTYREAKQLLSSHSAKKRSTVMISHPEHYSLVDHKGTGDPIAYTVDDSLAGLRVAARQVSLDKNFKQILVMGGRSVYRAFAGHYDDFIHCQVVTNEPSPPEGGGAIKMAELLESPDTVHDQHTDTPDLRHPQYRLTTLMAESGYVVSQYERIR